MGTPRPDTTEDSAVSDLFAPASRRGRPRQDAPVLAVIAVGGAIGACAATQHPCSGRPPPPVPWTILADN
ncbi:hypothetical protein GCM10023317_45780 [Actinopolymorpha pittospori]